MIQDLVSYFSTEQIKNVWRGFHPDYRAGKGIITLLQHIANNVITEMLCLKSVEEKERYMNRIFVNKKYLKRAKKYLFDWNDLKQKNKYDFESVLKVSKYSKDSKSIYPGALTLYLNPKGVENALKRNKPEKDKIEIKVYAAYLSNVAYLVLQEIIECMDKQRKDNNDTRSTYQLSYAEKCTHI